MIVKLDAMYLYFRTYHYQGPGQYVPLQPGRSYAVSAYVRLLNDHPGELRQDIQITVAFTFSGEI